MDSLTTRLVLIFAGITILAAMGGGIALAFYDRTLPDALIALGSGALGLLSGAALDTRGRQEVVVTNRADEAVPVDAGHADGIYLIVVTAIAVLVVTIYHLIVKYG